MMRGTNTILQHTFHRVLACAISGAMLHACTLPHVAVTVHNEYFETIHDIRVGMVHFDTLLPHTQSGKKMLAQGTWILRGRTQTGLRLRARLKVEQRRELRIIITHKGGVQVK